MRTKEKKVVFLSEVDSCYIEQAIFVLKSSEDDSICESGIVKEAERIVAQYTKQHLEKGICEYNEEKEEVPLFEFTAFPREGRLKRFFRKNAVLLGVLTAGVMMLFSFALFIQFYI